MRLIFLCLATIVLSACKPAEPPSSVETSVADLIVLNGKVYTQNQNAPWAEAFAVSGSKILAVGSSAEIRAYA